MNKDITKRKPGRPKAFEGCNELDEQIEKYKIHCLEHNDIFTIIGLCVFIGIHKDTFYEYAKNPLYSDSHKKALSLAEQALVNGSLTGKYNPAVSIFMLKNNHGYKDKQEQELSGGVEIKYYSPKKDPNL